MLCPSCRHAPQSRGRLAGGPSLVVGVEEVVPVVLGEVVEGVVVVREVVKVVVLVEGMEAVV